MPTENKTIENFLQEWAQSVTDMIRENLESKGEYYRRSTLAQEIIALPVESTNDGYRLVITMPDYGQFIDKGVRGNKTSFAAPQSEYEFRNKMPPVDSIVLWIKKRGDINVALSTKKKEKLKSLKTRQIKKAFKQRSFDYQVRQVAFAIAKGVQQKGIRATHFYSEIVNDDLLNELSASLGSKYGEMFEAEIVSL